MTSYCYRITAGAGVSNRPIRLSRMTTSSTRTVEISRLPQKYCSNHHHHHQQQRSRMVLRSRKIIRAAVVEAVGPCGDGEDKAAAAGTYAYAVENLSSLTTEEESDQDRTAEMESEEENGEKKNKGMDQSQTVKVAVAAAVTVVMGVGNRVLYKLALVPLKQYPFFLAQLATFGYFFSFSYFLSLTFFFTTFKAHFGILLVWNLE